MGWLKGCHSAAARHEKLAINFAAVVTLVFRHQNFRNLGPSDRTSVRSFELR
jgi:hypothetical protein